MKYIRIANESSSVNRLYLEKLGISTKRDNNDTIGQFGSGSKFAPIAALRKNWEWINVGHDDSGDYRLEYVVKEEAGIDCIYYLYDNEILKPSSFTVDAGVLSWENGFQIFREAFTNALDDFREFGNKYVVEFADEVKNEDGTFAVYLTADPELVNIVNDFDRYFSINRTPIGTTTYGKIYNSFNGAGNFYYKGVLVHTAENSDSKVSLFDYELNDVILNEERRVRSTYQVELKVISMFSSLRGDDPEHLDIAKTLILNKNNNIWEWSVDQTYIDSYFNPMTDNAFKTAWTKMYGDKIAVHSSLMKFRAQFYVRNYEIVEVQSETLYKILRASGVNCADNVLGDEAKYDFCELSPELNDMYSEAIDIISESGILTNFDKYLDKIKFFVPQGEQDHILGVANYKDDSIYISLEAFNNMSTLVGTIVHEYDHLHYSVGDDDPEFRIIADCHIGDLMVKLHGGFA